MEWPVNGRKLTLFGRRRTAGLTREWLLAQLMYNFGKSGLAVLDYRGKMYYLTASSLRKMTSPKPAWHSRAAEASQSRPSRHHF